MNAAPCREGLDRRLTLRSADEKVLFGNELAPGFGAQPH